MSSAQKLNAHWENTANTPVKAQDVVVVADEENQKKIVPEEKQAVPEEGSGMGWLAGGIVCGVLMTIGIGVLTSMVVRGKNDNNALVESNQLLNARLKKLQQETGTPIDTPVVKPGEETENPVVLTPAQQLNNHIETLFATRENIVNQATEMIRTDIAKQVNEVETQAAFMAWKQNLVPFEFSDYDHECFDCDYAKLDLADGSKYFGQVKNGMPQGRGAHKNNAYGVWSITEGYFEEGKVVGANRRVSGKPRSGLAVVVETNQENDNKVTKYICKKKTKTCELKVEEQHGIPEEPKGDDVEKPEGDDFAVDEDATETEFEDGSL